MNLNSNDVELQIPVSWNWNSSQQYRLSNERARGLLEYDEGVSTWALLAMALLTVIIVSLVYLAQLLRDTEIPPDIANPVTTTATTSGQQIVWPTSPTTKMIPISTTSSASTQVENCTAPQTSTPDVTVMASTATTATTLATTTSTRKTTTEATSAEMFTVSTTTSSTIMSTSTMSTSSMSTSAIMVTLAEPSTASELPETTTTSDIYVVNTSRGAIAGKIVSGVGKDAVKYLGIPYAEDTGGAKRFQAPREVMPWNDTFEAFQPGPSCYQPWPVLKETPKEVMSEGCLSINVWAPHCADGEQHCPLRSVIIYIIGRDLLQGSNSMTMYDGTNLSLIGDVVVVVPNYRLGVFGFLGRQVSGTQPNVGFLDLAMAVEWVRENIEAFGGNKHNLTMFGHDWGAYIAGLFVLTPKYNIRRGILGSGSPLMVPRYDANDTDWKMFLKHLNCDGNASELSSCMQNVSADQLLQAQGRYPTSVNITLRVIRDHFNPHQLKHVELLFTNTLLEGYGQTQSLLKHLGSRELTLEAILDSVGITSRLKLLGNLIFQLDIRNTYKIIHRGLREFAEEFLGDVYYNCVSTLFAKMMCKSSAAVYHFIVGRKPQYWMPSQTKPSHLDDLIFVFYRVHQLLPSEVFPSELGDDEKYARNLIRILTGFAKEGRLSQDVNINADFCHNISNLLGRSRRKVSHWRANECSLLDEVTGYTRT